MPRRKRPLQEADSNGYPSEPPAKRPSLLGNDAGQSKSQTASYSKKTVIELRALLKERSLPSNGQKAELVLRLEEADAQVPQTKPLPVSKEIVSKAKPSSSRSSIGKIPKSLQKVVRSPANLTSQPSPTIVGKATAQDVKPKPADSEPDISFHVVCRPEDDIRKQRIAEWRADHEKLRGKPYPDIFRDVNRICNRYHPSWIQGGESCGADRCICGQQPSRHPGWKWITSSQGETILKHSLEECIKRDQDMKMEYWYKQFNADGFQEVIENTLLKFHEEFTRKPQKVESLWPYIEALSQLIPCNGYWFDCPDLTMVLDTLRMIGGAVMSTLKLLEQKGLFKITSPIQNISIVLGSLYGVDDDWPSGPAKEDELTWTHAMVKMANSNGIILKDAPYGVEEKIAKRSAGKKIHKSWFNFDWEREFSLFKHRQIRRHGQMGGKQYVLFQYRHAGHDLLEDMLTPSEEDENDLRELLEQRLEKETNTAKKLAILVLLDEPEY